MPPSSTCARRATNRTANTESTPLIRISASSGPTAPPSCCRRRTRRRRLSRRPRAVVYYPPTSAARLSAAGCAATTDHLSFRGSGRGGHGPDSGPCLPQPLNRSVAHRRGTHRVQRGDKLAFLLVEVGFESVREVRHLRSQPHWVVPVGIEALDQFLDPVLQFGHDFVLLGELPQHRFQRRE